MVNGPTLIAFTIEVNGKDSALKPTTSVSLFLSSFRDSSQLMNTAPDRQPGSGAPESTILTDLRRPSARCSRVNVIAPGRSTIYGRGADDPNFKNDKLKLSISWSSEFGSILAAGAGNPKITSARVRCNVVILAARVSGKTTLRNA